MGTQELYTNRTIMRVLLICSFLTLCSGCCGLFWSEKKPMAVSGGSFTEEEKLIANINESFTQNDKSMFLSYVSQPYQKDQLKFLKNDTNQFISELQCGTLKSGKYKCPAWKDIQSWTLVSTDVTKYGIAFITVNVILTNDEVVKIPSLTLKREQGEWRVIGASG